MPPPFFPSADSIAISQSSVGEFSFRTVVEGCSASGGELEEIERGTAILQLKRSEIEIVFGVVELGRRAQWLQKSCGDVILEIDIAWQMVAHAKGIELVPNYGLGAYSCVLGILAQSLSVHRMRHGQGQGRDQSSTAIAIVVVVAIVAIVAIVATVLR